VKIELSRNPTLPPAELTGGISSKAIPVQNVTFFEQFARVLSVSRCQRFISRKNQIGPASDAHDDSAIFIGVKSRQCDRPFTVDETCNAGSCFWRK
jgi:hypothetical protein